MDRARAAPPKNYRRLLPWTINHTQIARVIARAHRSIARTMDISAGMKIHSDGRRGLFQFISARIKGLRNKRVELWSRIWPFRYIDPVSRRRSVWTGCTSICVQHTDRALLTRGSSTANFYSKFLFINRKDTLNGLVIFFIFIRLWTPASEI